MRRKKDKMEVGEEKKADFKKYLTLDLRIIVGTIIHSQKVRTIPEKAVKMTLEISDDPRSSSTCDGREMVKDDRKGGRKGGRIGEEEVAEEVMEIRGKNTNTKGETHQRTKFSFIKKTVFSSLTSLHL